MYCIDWRHIAFKFNLLQQHDLQKKQLKMVTDWNQWLPSNFAEHIYIYIAELQSVLNATFKVDLLDSRFATLEKMMVWTI